MRIAKAKDGSLLATRTKKVDSHLAVVTGAVVLAHEDVEKRKETFVEMVAKGERTRRMCAVPCVRWLLCNVLCNDIKKPTA